MKALKVAAALLLVLGLSAGLARLVPAFAAPQAVNTISGSVFQDVNLSRSLDDGEPGAPGVRLELYRDGDGNGLIDKHDRRLAKTTTDEEGQFAFRIAQVGAFLVKVDAKSLPQGSSLTTLNRQAASFSEIGETDSDNHFGYTDALYVADEVLVKFVAGTSKQRIKEIMDGYGLKLKRHQAGIDVYLLTTPPGEVDAVIAYLVTYPEVEYAERNGLVSGGYTPKDPQYVDPKNYGLIKIEAEAAWRYHQGQRFNDRGGRGFRSVADAPRIRRPGDPGLGLR